MSEVLTTLAVVCDRSDCPEEANELCCQIPVVSIHATHLMGVSGATRTHMCPMVVAGQAFAPPHSSDVQTLLAP